MCGRAPRTICFFDHRVLLKRLLTHSSTSGTRGKRGALAASPRATRRNETSGTIQEAGPGMDHHCQAGGMHRRVYRFSSRSPGYWPKPAMIPSGCRGDNCPGTSAPSRCRCCRTVTASTQTAAGPDRGPDEPAGCRTLLLLRKRAIRCIGHCVWQPAVYQRRSGDRQSQGHQRIYAVLR